MSAGGFRPTGATRGEWDISAGCQAPVPVEVDGAPARIKGGKTVRAQGRGYSMLLHTRCRKCTYCLNHRRRLWTARATTEVITSQRTWFATFTLSPREQFVMQCRASARLASGGVFLEHLSPDEKFAELSREVGAELTLYFKRLRKNTGAKLRYILVPEPHKSGLPHYHALIHETLGSNALTHRALTSCWTLGYTQFKLVSDVRSARYVAKYLTKQARLRVRSSLAYGSYKGQSLDKTTLSPSNTNVKRDLATSNTHSTVEALTPVLTRNEHDRENQMVSPPVRPHDSESTQSRLRREAAGGSDRDARDAGPVQGYKRRSTSFSAGLEGAACAHSQYSTRGPIPADYLRRRYQQERRDGKVLVQGT